MGFHSLASESGGFVSDSLLHNVRTIAAPRLKDASAKMAAGSDSGGFSLRTGEVEEFRPKRPLGSEIGGFSGKGAGWEGFVREIWREKGVGRAENAWELSEWANVISLFAHYRMFSSPAKRIYHRPRSSLLIRGVSGFLAVRFFARTKLSL